MKLPDASLRDLVHQCIQSGNQEAWEEFINRLQPVFARIAWRIAQERFSPQPSDIDDLLQDVFAKIARNGQELLRLMPGDSDEAVRAYLKVSAANTMRDILRARYADKRGGAERMESLEAETVQRLALSAPGIDLDTQVLYAEIDAALDATPLERTIFWLYYRTGLTAREIAGLPTIALGPKGVESLLRRLIDGVRGMLGFDAGSRSP
jgi:RNA polymerase sigma-70 factor (ECF subfamily)